MLVNAFNILDNDLNSIGTGIYLGVSIIDHSCQPNAVATFDGLTLNVRAIKAIPKLDFALIFISYIDLANTAEQRQRELQQNYFFLCECARCLGEIVIVMGMHCALRVANIGAMHFNQQSDDLYDVNLVFNVLRSC